MDIELEPIAKTSFDTDEESLTPASVRNRRLCIVSVSAFLLLAFASVATFQGYHSMQRVQHGALRYDFVSEASGRDSHAVNESVPIVEDAYTLIIDCGSSGTRAKVFKHTEAGVEQVKGTPKMAALSDFHHDPDSLKKPLQKMINETLDIIPKANWQTTTLYMFATAGMRVFSSVDQDLVFSVAQDTLKESSYFILHPGFARTLSGELEALFSYIMVNYIKCGRKACGDTPTTGIVEVGGASMQVAFTPKNTILEGEFQYSLIGGEPRAIYAHSWMMFGQNEARRRANELLFAADPKDPVQNPCLLKGFVENVSLFENKTLVSFMGSGDAEGCKTLTKKLLHREYECMLKPCSIMGHYTPEIAGHFIGIGAVYFAFSNLGIKDTPEPQALEEATDKFCKADLVATKKKSGKYWKYNQYNCFLGHFVRQLLAAFGFPDTGGNLTVANKLDGDDISWPLGAMLYQEVAYEGMNAGKSGTGRRLADLPGTRPIPGVDMTCYKACLETTICPKRECLPKPACHGRCKTDKDKAGP